ncbi:MAG: DUF86 domain-containing protein [bacterium]|nr:DUF86 domain-containing protein [bacterium]
MASQLQAEDCFEQTRKYLEQERDVLLAFAFGSMIKGIGREDSDLDIGVYLKDKKKEDKIWLEITRIIDREVDLILLDNAPATLVSNILKTGIPLVIKDRRLYWDIYLTKTLESEDLCEFIEDYWKIYLRSRSLIQEDRVRLIERIEFLRSEFEEIEEFKGLSFTEYSQNKAKRRNIERWVENIINATIDIAKIILASEKSEIPKTYEQALLNFGLFISLNEKESERLSAFARLRNILAHEYLDIIYERIKRFIKESLPIYQRVFDFLLRYTATETYKGENLSAPGSFSG